jgi:hypothetical protein
MSGTVIPIEALDTFDSASGLPDFDGYPTAYARAKAEHERRQQREERVMRHNTNGRAWTMGDDALLREYAHEGRADVALRLGRSVSAVAGRAHALKVSLGGGRGGHHPRARATPPLRATPSPAPRYHCLSLELVPSCPLRTEHNDCTGDFPRDKYPPTVDECKAAAMPVLGGPPSAIGQASEQVEASSSGSSTEVEEQEAGTGETGADYSDSITPQVTGPTVRNRDSDEDLRLEAAVLAGVHRMADAAIPSQQEAFEATGRRVEVVLQRYVGVDVKPILEAVSWMLSGDQQAAEVVYDTHSGRVVALVRHPTSTGIGAFTLAAALSLAEEALQP